MVRFGSIIGRSALEKRTSDIRVRMAAEPVLGELLGQEYATELALERLYRRHRSTGRWPKVATDRQTLAALSFAVAITEVHHRLSDEPRRRLERRLYGCLKGQGSLSPMVHEMLVACHLMGHGWDVQFSDLERGGGFDYLAKLGTDEVELECKRASADTGRKIHRADFRRLAGLLLPELERHADAALAGIIHLQVAGRLHSDDANMSKFKAAAVRTIETGQVTNGDGFLVRFIPATLVDPMTAGEELLRDQVETLVEAENCSFLYGAGGGSVVAFAATSERPDQVLTYIYRQLKDATAQFSGDRPAVLWTHIDGIEPHQWYRLTGDTGLQRMSNRYMHGRGRGHVFSMAYSSAPGMVTHSPGEVQESGPLMHFDDPQHRDLANRLYGLAKVVRT